jgi:hypothetical protein
MKASILLRGTLGRGLRKVFADPCLTTWLRRRYLLEPCYSIAPDYTSSCFCPQSSNSGNLICRPGLVRW